MMNKQIILKERPIGFPNDTTWNLESNAIPTLKEGEVLIQHHYISLDPSLNGKYGSMETFKLNHPLLNIKFRF